MTTIVRDQFCIKTSVALLLSDLIKIIISLTWKTQIKECWEPTDI